MVHYSDLFLKMSPSRSPHCAPLDHVLYDQWKCCYKHLCVHTTDCKILDGNGKNSLRLLMRSRFPATSRHQPEVFSTKGHKALVIVISLWLSTPLECSHMCVKTATLKALTARGGYFEREIGQTVISCQPFFFFLPLEAMHLLSFCTSV